MEAMLEQFQHLLQPMRDLEQNWSVDLVEELTQAFSLLSEHCIAFGQHGDEILDFGKAALFIQGGAHVYSKKVDYLYKSVYELKEWMEKLWEEEKKRKRKGDAQTQAMDEQSLNDDSDLNLSDVDLDNLDDPTVLTDDQELDQLLGSVLLPSKPMSSSTDILSLKIPLRSCAGDIIAYLNELSHVDTRQIWSEILDLEPAVAECSCLDKPTVHYPEPGPHEADDVCMAEDIGGEPTQVFPAMPSAPGPKTGENLRPRRNLIAAPERKEDEIDPWTLILDPYDVCTRQSKPLKPGNCKRPNSLQRGKKRTKDGQVTEKPTDIVAFCNKEFCPQLSNLAGSSELFDTLRQVFAVELRERQRRIRTLMASRTKGSGEGFGDEDLDQENEHGDLDPEDDNSDLRPGDACSPLNIENLEMVCGSEAVPDVYSDYIRNALHRRIGDLADNDKLSELDKRVKLWESSVKSALDEAESRPPFDMRHYSSLIFSSFETENQSIEFESVLNEKPKHEAFRTFVSALILANSGNVEIQPAGKEDSCFKLKLLDRSTISERIGEEFKPSH